MATQAYDAVIATITVANDATSVTKAMIQSTTWREGTSGAWQSGNCTLTAGKVYQFRSPNNAFAATTTATLPNIKADVTIKWDDSGNPITTVGNYFMQSYARGCANLLSLGVPDTSGLTEVGINFMSVYAFRCTNLTALAAPDASGLAYAPNFFMLNYANGCTKLTTLDAPITSNLTSAGPSFLAGYAFGCTGLLSLSIPDTSKLEQAFANFLASYASGCTNLKSINIPDTSKLNSVSGGYFMASSFKNCNALEELVLPSSLGWYEDNNVSWDVASGRLGILKGVTPNAAAKAAWDLLTVSGKTLYTNYIQSTDNVIIDGGEPEPQTNIPVFMAHYRRLRSQ